jgi:lipopolysaccharide export system permease protein
MTYVEQIFNHHNKANNIFIAEEPKPGNTDNPSWVVISAEHAYQTKVNHINYIVSIDGYRYEGVPGHKAFKVIQFKEYALRLPQEKVSTRFDQETLNTKALWQGYKNPLYASELQWRLSMPLLSLILTLLAVPLSKVKPRQGRYGNLLIGILLYIIYLNLLFVSRNWLENHALSRMVGLWWVHLLFLSVGLIWFTLQQRVQKPFTQTFSR